MLASDAPKESLYPLKSCSEGTRGGSTASALQTGQPLHPQALALQRADRSGPGEVCADAGAIAAAAIETPRFLTIVSNLNLERDPTLRIRFPEAEEPDEANALTPDQLGALLGAMERLYPHHHALVATLAYTGLRFCHASALRWQDMDEDAAVLHIARKNIRGRIGPVSRRKRAPREYPLHPELARILREHRQRMLAKQVKGLEEGWMFPSANGKPRTHTGLQKAWAACLKAAEIKERFTIHGLRRTFNDLSRRAGVDAVVTKSLTGHVTEKMREHYSTVGLDEKRAAIAGVVKLVIPPSGDRGGDRPPENEAAG